MWSLNMHTSITLLLHSSVLIIYTYYLQSGELCSLIFHFTMPVWDWCSAMYKQSTFRTYNYIFPLLVLNSFNIWNMWSAVLCTLWNRLVDLPTQHLAENFQSVPSCLRLQGWRGNCRKTKEDSHHGACRWSSALPLSHLSHRHPLWLEVAESPHKHETAGGPEVATATGQSDNKTSSLKTACFAN